MTEVNMFDAKTNLSMLIKKLENREEDVIYIARNGVEVAQLTLIPQKDVSGRIGIAAGKITLPEGFDETFDSLDEGIGELFEGDGLL